MLIAVMLAVVIVSGLPAALHRVDGLRRLVPRAHSRVRPSDEVALLNGLAAELRAGASLRAALVAAAARVPHLDLGQVVRIADAGLPVPDLAATLAEMLPANGRLVGAAFRLVATSGGRAAVMFEGLALRAAEAGELSRERHSLTAQARLSALVVGGVPLTLAVLSLATGRVQMLLVAGAPGRLVALVGIGFELAGLAAIGLILRRAEQAP